MIPNLYHDIKIYQINSEFHELVGKERSTDKISHIIEYHRTHFNSQYSITSKTNHVCIDTINYTIYVFNEVEQESPWKTFFPREITDGYEFNIRNTSFVLFIEIETYIFAIIGGRGIAAIKRFINHSFGIDLYEKISEPENDILSSVLSRGVSGNFTSEQITYRNEQKLQDSLSIGRVPNKLTLILRQDLKDSIFDFINFNNNENIYIEISAYFCLKWKLSFSETHQFIFKIVEIIKNGKGKPLSRFEKVNDQRFCNENLKMALYTHLRDDMVRLNDTGSKKPIRLDYDFVHPQKMNAFYECDIYKVYLKGAKKPFYETRDRSTIYHETLKFIYGIISPNDQWDFIRAISGVRVRGYTGEQKKTEAPFINHITCEIPLSNTPYFLINDIWYKVRGNFIKFINDQCSSMIKATEWVNHPLTIPWPLDEIDEGEYNLQYLYHERFVVLDKMLGQNIELCDLLYKTEEYTYLIHVKEGFDAKIRDVTNQVSISANRLWNDLKSDMKFLNEVYDRYYSSTNYNGVLTKEDFIKMFTSKNIIYAIAFCHKSHNKRVAENTEHFKSNIAKFSIIQSIKEMQANTYPLRIIEIKNRPTLMDSQQFN